MLVSKFIAAAALTVGLIASAMPANAGGYNMQHGTNDSTIEHYLVQKVDGRRRECRFDRDYGWFRINRYGDVVPCRRDRAYGVYSEPRFYDEPPVVYVQPQPRYIPVPPPVIYRAPPRPVYVEPNPGLSIELNF
jgi:hypothetical protein